VATPPTSVRTVFDAIDRNHDGVITRSEWNQAMEQTERLERLTMSSPVREKIRVASPVRSSPPARVEVHRAVMEPTAVPVAASTAVPVAVETVPTTSCSFPVQVVQHPVVAPPVMTPPVMTPPPESRSPRRINLVSPTMAITDTCSMSPALRAWIECQVDARVETAFRVLREGELTNVLAQIRREGASGSSSAVQQAQQAEHERRRLESEVRTLADAQERLVTLVDRISGDADKQQHATSKVRAEALVTVEKVMSTVEELQRNFEQDGDGVAAKLARQEALLGELRRAAQEDHQRHKAAIAELQRAQHEQTSRQRHWAEELANTSSVVASVRQEVNEVAGVVQKTEHKFGSWRAEVFEAVQRLALDASQRVSVELGEQLSSATAAHDSEVAGLRQRLDTAHRELSGVSSARAELEARVEGLRLEVASFSTLPSEIERRLQEQQTLLIKRIDGIQSAAGKDIQELRHEFDEVVHLVQRIDQRSNTLRTDLMKDLRDVASGRETEAGSVETLRRELDALRREMSTLGVETLRRELASIGTQWTDVEARLQGRVDRLQVDLSTGIAGRDSFDARLRDSQDEIRRIIAEFREEQSSISRRLTAEMRGEIRAAMKADQNQIAALDEQLWLTDQRLGQRIDELAHVQERVVVSAASSAVTNHTPITNESVRVRVGGSGSLKQLPSGQTYIAGTPLHSVPATHCTLQSSPAHSTHSGGVLAMAREAAETLMDGAHESHHTDVSEVRHLKPGVHHLVTHMENSSSSPSAYVADVERLPRMSTTSLRRETDSLCHSSLARDASWESVHGSRWS